MSVRAKSIFLALTDFAVIQTNGSNLELLFGTGNCIREKGLFPLDLIPGYNSLGFW